MTFESDYQFTEAVADFYGELEDYIMVRLEEGKVQVRKVVNKNVKVNQDGTVSPIDPSKPSRIATQ